MPLKPRHTHDQPLLHLHVSEVPIHHEEHEELLFGAGLLTPPKRPTDRSSLLRVRSQRKPRVQIQPSRREHRLKPELQQICSARVSRPDRGLIQEEWRPSVGRFGGVRRPAPNAGSGDPRRTRGRETRAERATRADRAFYRTEQARAGKAAVGVAVAVSEKT